MPLANLIIIDIVNDNSHKALVHLNCKCEICYYYYTDYIDKYANTAPIPKELFDSCKKHIAVSEAAICLLYVKTYV